LTLFVQVQERPFPGAKTVKIYPLAGGEWAVRSVLKDLTLLRLLASTFSLGQPLDLALAPETLPWE